MPGENGLPVVGDRPGITGELVSGGEVGIGGALVSGDGRTDGLDPGHQNGDGGMLNGERRGDG